MLGPSGLGCFCTWTAETYMGVGAGVQGLGLGLFEVEPNIQSRSEKAEDGRAILQGSRYLCGTDCRLDRVPEKQNSGQCS